MATRPLPKREQKRVVDEYAFGWCRSVQHQWEPLNGNAPLRKEGRAVIEELSCANCGSVRTRTMEYSDGTILSTYFRYAPGYRLLGFPQEERPTRADMRKAYHRKVL